jgi:hypothetical protein
MEINPLKIGRNSRCPCDSGKKYKKCCLDPPREKVDLEMNEEKPYTEPMAQFGVAKDYLMNESATLLQLKQRAGDLLTKVQKKWAKKRTLQIGMFEDTLAVAHVYKEYTDALEKEAISNAAELAELKGEVKPLKPLPVEPEILAQLPPEEEDEVSKEPEATAEATA